jgi:hypothetical protein
MNTVKAAFLLDTIRLPLAKILPSGKLKPGIESTPRYKVIEASVREVGIIEPLVVYPELGKSGTHVLLDCRHRRERDPVSAESPVPRGPAAGAETVLRLSLREPWARVVRGAGLAALVCSGEGEEGDQVRALRKPFSSTKCSARSVRRSAMTWALSASGNTLVQSLNARLVVMQVERRKS